MSYILKVNNKVISKYELDENRKKYLKMQKEHGGPILFCNCSMNKIPMILTEHSKGPHLRTKSNSDIALHYTFCRHYHDKKNNGYKPAISYLENGEEIFHIDWEHDDDYLDNQINDLDYRNKYSILYNNASSVTQNKMTFDAFIKHRNMKYFELYQRTEFKKNHNYTFKLDDFHRRLYGYISHAHIGATTIEKANKGKFLYKYVRMIDKETYNEDNKVKIETNDKFIFCTNKIYQEALTKFERTYNNLDLENLINREDLFIVCYGMNNNDKFPICNHMGFILVNKYGLFCESLHEVEMFNYISDFIFSHNLQNKYLFYKPTSPENDYGNPNYISDGIIRNYVDNNKIVIEVFGREEKEYLERKEQKKKTCKHRYVFWDVLDNESWNESVKRLSNLLYEEK